MRKTVSLVLTIVMMLSLLVIGVSADTAVARIIKADKTEKAYTSIEDAADALADGDTLELLANVPGFYVEADNKKLTIVGKAGVVVDGSVYIMDCAEGKNGEVTIKDVTVDTANAGTYGVYAGDHTKVTLNNCHISMHAASGTNMCICTGSNSPDVSLSVYDSELSMTESGYGMYMRSGQTVRFEDTKFKSDNTRNLITVDKDYGGGSIDVIRCEFTSEKGIISVSGVNTPDNMLKINVKDSTFNYTGTGASYIYGGDKKYDITIDNVTAVSNDGSYFLRTNGINNILSLTMINNSPTNEMFYTFYDIPGITSATASVAPNSTGTLDIGQKRLDAEAALNAAAGKNPSDAVRKIVADALAEIQAKETSADVEAAKNAALGAVAAQQQSEYVPPVPQEPQTPADPQTPSEPQEPASETGDALVWFILCSVLAVLAGAAVCKKQFGR